MSKYISCIVCTNLFKFASFLPNQLLPIIKPIDTPNNLLENTKAGCTNFCIIIDNDYPPIVQILPLCKNQRLRSKEGQ